MVLWGLGVARWNKNRSKINLKKHQILVSIFCRFWTPLGTIWGSFGEPFGVFGPPKGLLIIGQGALLYLLIDVLVDLGSQEAILEQFGTVQVPQKGFQGPCWMDF